MATATLAAASGPNRFKAFSSAPRWPSSSVFRLGGKVGARQLVHTVAESVQHALRLRWSAA